MDRCLLCDIEVGESARVLEIGADSFTRRRLLDIGLSRGALVKKIMKSPCGDLTAYLIRGTVIAIRKKDAQTIAVVRGENSGT